MRIKINPQDLSDSGHQCGLVKRFWVTLQKPRQPTRDFGQKTNCVAPFSPPLPIGLYASTRLVLADKRYSNARTQKGLITNKRWQIRQNGWNFRPKEPQLDKFVRETCITCRNKRKSNLGLKGSLRWRKMTSDQNQILHSRLWRQNEPFAKLPVRNSKKGPFHCTLIHIVY